MSSHQSSLSVHKAGNSLPNIIRNNSQRDLYDQVGVGRSVFGGAVFVEQESDMKTKGLQRQQNRLANITYEVEEMKKKRLLSLGAIDCGSQSVIDLPLSRKTLLIPLRDVDPNSFVKKEKYTPYLKTYSHKATDTTEDFKHMMGIFAAEKDDKSHQLNMLMNDTEKHINQLDSIILQKRDFESKHSTEVSGRLKEVSKQMHKRFQESELYVMDIVKQQGLNNQEEIRDFSSITRELKGHVKKVQQQTAERIFRLASFKQQQSSNNLNTKSSEPSSPKKKQKSKVEQLENLLSQKQIEYEKKVNEFGEVCFKLETQDQKLQQLVQEIEGFRKQFSESDQGKSTGDHRMKGKSRNEFVQVSIVDPMMGSITQQLNSLMMENMSLKDELDKIRGGFISDHNKMSLPKSVEETLLVLLKSDLSSEEMLLAIQELFQLQRHQTPIPRPKDFMADLKLKLKQAKSFHSGTPGDESKLLSNKSSVQTPLLFPENRHQLTEEDAQNMQASLHREGSFPELNSVGSLQRIPVSKSSHRGPKTIEVRDTNSPQTEYRRQVSATSIVSKKPSKFSQISPTNNIVNNSEGQRAFAKGEQFQRSMKNIGQIVQKNSFKNTSGTNGYNNTSSSSSQQNPQNSVTLNTTQGVNQTFLNNSTILIQDSTNPQRIIKNTIGLPTLEDQNLRNETVHEANSEEERGNLYSHRLSVFSDEEETIDPMTGAKILTRIQKQLIEVTEKYEENGVIKERKVIRAVPHSEVHQMLKSGEASYIQKRNSQRSSVHEDDNSDLQTTAKIKRNGRYNSEQTEGNTPMNTENKSQYKGQLYSPSNRSQILSQDSRKNNRLEIKTQKRFLVKEIDEVFSEEEEMLDAQTGQKVTVRVKKQFVTVEEEEVQQDGSVIMKTIKKAVSIDQAKALIEQGKATKVTKNITVEITQSDNSQEIWLEPASKKSQALSTMKFEPQYGVEVIRKHSKSVSTTCNFTQTPPQLLKPIIQAYFAKLNLTKEQQESLKQEMINNDQDYERQMLLSEKREEYGDDERFENDLEAINADIDVKIQSQQYISSLGLDSVQSQNDLRSNKRDQQSQKMSEVTTGNQFFQQKDEATERKNLQEFLYQFQSKLPEKPDSGIYFRFDMVDLNNPKQLLAEGHMKVLWDRLIKNQNHERVQELLKRIKQSLNKLPSQQLTYQEFKQFYSKTLATHKSCGDSCVHLQRFFKLLGFETLFYLKRKEIKPTKTQLSPF